MSAISNLSEKILEVEQELNIRDIRLNEIQTEIVTEWPAALIRKTFIDFFVKKKGHTFWPSSPVVPVNDPTLLFANSGMNQYKPLFLGTCDPTLEMSKLKMAVNSQKCIRAGGKHNDLEDVGKDVYHHTFFEMLGNWSFGHYFKEEAIPWAWECLTVEFGIDPTRLYATYFGGDESLGLGPDLEARDIWLRFLPASRIIPCGCKDNFWEMGPTGPCGPCTEIHFDRIGGRDAAALVNADRPDVIEIWNNVFIQFNREADGSLKELPSKHVDTGMGFERLSSILQGKDSNYDTDIFMPIFAAIQEVTGCRAYQGKLGPEDIGLVDMAYRVVADHIRTLTFAVTDGAIPSSEGRGYVLRRILRRAVRYGQELLNAPPGFFTKLVPVVVANFSDAFPELTARLEFVQFVVADEETSFNRTLDQGVRHFKKVVASMEAAGVKMVPAKDAHILFSSMGFPLDLTELMAAERDLTVDKVGFEELMENDRKISEAAEQSRKNTGSRDMTMEAEQTAWLQTRAVPITDSDLKYSWDVAPVAQVQAVFLGRGGQTAGFVESAGVEHDLVGVVLNQTSFYYESGGQIFDTGVLESLDGTFRLNVLNSQSYAGYVVHVGTLDATSSSIQVGASVSVKVDYERRGYVAPNHTMTHVLNYALKTVLMGPNKEGGDSSDALSLCDQKGSLVDADRLRFDFSWTAALTAAQTAQVEQLVNDKIRAGLPVFAQIVPLASATQITSLRKVFGERYPDPVRVISVGADVEALIAQPNNPAWHGLSIEFCGGTHLTNTSQAEDFVITEESGIAKGIRRISGLTRLGARQARARNADLTNRISQMDLLGGGEELVAQFKLVKIEVDQAVISLVDKEALRVRLATIYETIKAFYKVSLARKVSEASILAEEAAKAATTCNQAVVVINIEFGADGKVAKKLLDRMRAIHSEGSFFVSSLDEENEKVGLFPIVSAVHITKGLSAKEWVEHCFAGVGAGKGGGRADQANGSIPGGADTLKQVLILAQQFADSKLM